MKYHCIAALLAIILTIPACKGPDKTASQKEHPWLVKTIGNPRYGNVQTIVEDKAGNLWLGTTSNGLYKYDGVSFTQFLVDDGLSSNNVYAILEDQQGRLWIGTEAGPCLYDGKTFTRLTIPLPEDLPANNNPTYRNSHWVYSIMQASSGAIWFVTIDGIYVYDDGEASGGQASFRLFKADEAPNGFLTGNDKAERILEDRSGNIWFGGRTNEGVFRYDGKAVTNLETQPLVQEGPVPKSTSWGWPQVQDRKGNIWFSNWGGAYRYDGKAFTAYGKGEGMPGAVAVIIEDKKGNLWFGGSDGLSRYDGKTFKRFGMEDGLVNPWTWSLLEDKAGNIWVGTRETGLYLFDGERFIPYSKG